MMFLQEQVFFYPVHKNVVRNLLAKFARSTLTLPSTIRANGKIILKDYWLKIGRPQADFCWDTKTISSLRL
jgi:hypothetical protein